MQCVCVMKMKTTRTQSIKALVGTAVAATLSTSEVAFASDPPAWDKTFPRSEKVEHRKVTFKNRYGITLSADLYQPKNRNGKVAALAVSGPFGAVKEQSSGLYAQTMAERGWSDPDHTSEDLCEMTSAL